MRKEDERLGENKENANGIALVNDEK